MASDFPPFSCTTLVIPWWNCSLSTTLLQSSFIIPAPGSSDCITPQHLSFYFGSSSSDLKLYLPFHPLSNQLQEVNFCLPSLLLAFVLALSANICPATLSFCLSPAVLSSVLVQKNLSALCSWHSKPITYFFGLIFPMTIWYILSQSRDSSPKWK